MSRDLFLKALRLFIAAFGALLVAHALGLSNPYWAAMPVWVVIQPFREDILIRGGLRLLGTVIGAAIGFAVIHFLQAPFWIGVVLVATVATGAALAYWIGSIYAYGAMIAGMTCAVIVLPAFGAHADAFSLSVDRFWCTLIGVAAVTISTFVFTPERPHSHPLRLDHDLPATFGRFLTAGLLVTAGFVALVFIGGFAGLGFAMGMSIFATVIGSFPNPAPLVKYMPPGSLIGVILGLSYRFIGTALGLDETAMVLFAGLFIAVGAVLRSHPRTAPFGLDTNMVFLLSAEVGLPGHSLPLLALGGGTILLAAFVTTTSYRLILKIPAFRVKA